MKRSGVRVSKVRVPLVTINYSAGQLIRNQIKEENQWKKLFRKIIF